MLQSHRRIADSVTLQEIATHLGAEIEGDPQLAITGVAPMETAGPSEITFLGNRAYASKVATSKAGAILIPAKHRDECPMPSIRVPEPRLAYAKVLDLFFAPARPAGGVHPTAIVPESTTVDASASIGAYSVLGENVTVGAGSVIHPHVVIYDGVQIGADCVIHSSAVIREHVTVGDRTDVQNGAIVGADGFGFAPQADRSWHKIPHTGRVILGDDVEIQAGACVDRAAVGDTTIGRGTKIDNLVQVGHGCHIGEDTLVCGLVGLAGSTTIGNRVIIAGQAGLAGHLTVEDDVTVGAQAGVISDLETGKTYHGQPAMESRRARNVYLHLSRLPELVKRVKALERAAEQPAE